jgi:hypothetical protein
VQVQGEYGTEQSQWRQEQGDTCTSGDISGDAGLVSDDAGLASDDFSSLQRAANSLKSGKIAAVQNDLAAVQQDLQALSHLSATPATATAAAMAAGNTALKDAANDNQLGRRAGDTISSEAQKLATTAAPFAGAGAGPGPGRSRSYAPGPAFRKS